MVCSMPGLPVYHQLLEFTHTHLHWVGDAIQPSHPVVPFSSHVQSFPASGSFLEEMSQFFTSGGQSIGVSASASVLPMNTQDWSPLGWTGWISLQSKGLSRVFSNAAGPEWATGISPCTPPTSGPHLMLFPLPVLRLSTLLPPPLPEGILPF